MRGAATAMSRHGLPSAVRKPTRMTAEQVAQGSLGMPHATSDLRTYRCFLSRTMRGICGVLDTLAHATRGLLRKQCAVATFKRYQVSSYRWQDLQLPQQEEQELLHV